MRPIFFVSAADLSAWLDARNADTREVWVGFHKRGSTPGALTYSEALDEALRIGWIDGVRKSLDGGRFTIRFSPRKADSKWSARNLRRVETLNAAGRMKPAGLAVFEGRRRAGAGYSFEERPVALDVASLGALRRNGKASAFFEAQAPSYQRTASFWVMSAKGEETRARRLRQLIESCQRGEWAPPFRWTSRKPNVSRQEVETRQRRAPRLQTKRTQ